MSEHDDMEKQLHAYREGRDKELPADRSLLPVHKDRLMAEARRVHGRERPGEAQSGWSLLLRPIVRWGVVAAPLLVLALLGYFWMRTAEPMNKAQVSAGETRPARNAKQLQQDDALQLADQAPSAPGLTEAETERTKEFAERKAPASPPAAAASPEPLQAPAEIAVAEGREEDSRSRADESSRLAGQFAAMAQAPLDLNGIYRGRVVREAESAEKPSVSTTRGFAVGSRDEAAPTGGKTDSPKKKLSRLAKDESGAGNFANFKLIQTQDSVTLVAANGDKYVGKVLNQSETQQLNQQRRNQVQTKNVPVQSPLRQATLVGTNAVTNKRMNLLANFYEEPVSTDKLEANEGLDSVQESPTQVRVVIEKLDADNQTQEIVIDAERVSAPPPR